MSHGWEGVRGVLEVSDKLKEVCVTWMGRGEGGEWRCGKSTVFAVYE